MSENNKIDVYISYAGNGSFFSFLFGF